MVTYKNYSLIRTKNRIYYLISLLALPGNRAARGKCVKRGFMVQLGLGIYISGIWTYC